MKVINPNYNPELTKHPHSCFGARVVDCRAADPGGMSRLILIFRQRPLRDYYVIMQEN